MSEMRKYGADALFVFPLIDAGTQDFVTSITPAAGDAKLFTNAQISANIAAETVPFTSLSELPTNGDTLVGATSGTSATFMFAVITSGTVGGGDAAGALFVDSPDGAFQSENLNISGGTSNVMTIGADTTAGLFVELGNGLFACALTSTEMQCQQGTINIIDSATKAWEDQAIQFTTYGNASALHAVDLNDSVRLGLTALPNAAADAAGGLPISDAGGLDIDALDTAVAAIQSLLDDARGEPGQGAPPVNPDAMTKIDYMYKWTRNKKDNDGTNNNYYADDASTVDQKQSTATSGGTTTIGEMVTGA